ncbi:MAG: FAD-dependent oxidoreductase [Granulosicoccus sp.]
MKTQTRVVVIGGGIAGCSTLYHLVSEGWADVVLVERNELTSGTTWHSAAQVTNFGMNQTMVALKSHSIALYQKLSADPEHPINYHHADGGIRLANDPRQMDGYRHFASVAKGMGVDFEVIDAEECARRHPLISTEGLLGGLWDPLDGDIDPAQLCQALARKARDSGAEIYRHTPVTALTQRADDSWIVHTEKGDIACDIIVNACGYRVNEVGAMMGVHHPVMSMEHQYFLTDPIEKLQHCDKRAPLLRCPITDFYSRQEKNGLLIGFYEQGCKTWGMDGIDPDFVNALCPDDIDRVTDVLEGVFERMPVLQDVGIRSIVNGPITYSIDGAPLVGPIPGKRNAFCIIGLRAGLGEGGGLGWLLAQQIVHGEACLDTWVIDPRRFTGHANAELCALKAIEEYQNEFRFHYPHEHRPAGRPVKSTPITPVLDAAGARFDVVNGWERLAYMKPDPDFHETHGFRFNETFDIVGSEVNAVQTSVGLTEINGFNRIKITGDHIHEWLDTLTCSAIPKKQGTIKLCYLLNQHGNIKTEATLASIDASTVWYGSAAASEYHDLEWLQAHAPDDGSIQIQSLTNDWTILLLAGPKSRDVLSVVSRDDWSRAAFPWLHVRSAFIGIVPAVVMSVSFSGELAFEIHVPNNQLLSAFNTLQNAGREHGLRLFGSHAVESMRVEKGYRHWKSDLVTEYNPFESSLDRFVSMDKGEFIGKDALQTMLENGLRRSFVSLSIDCTHAQTHAGASICCDGDVVGSVTSAAWGYRTGKNLCMGFVLPDFAQTGNQLTVDVVGVATLAEVVEPCQYDVENTLVRS